MGLVNESFGNMYKCKGTLVEHRKYCGTLGSETALRTTGLKM